jgi:uncharacterized cupredoxin-like copper-binding protein
VIELDEKWVLVVAMVAVALAALVLVVGAYAFWGPMWWAPGNAWGTPMGPMMRRTTGPMMGWCPCMQWMWGSGPQSQQRQQQPPPSRSPDVELTVYAGDFGFSLRPDAITSPGPELRVKVGSLVKLTVVNVGRAVHVLTIVGDLREDPNAVPVFSGASAGTPRNPIPPGSSVTVYLVAEKEGSYYYVCNVPGHTSLGMYGRFVVESA